MASMTIELSEYVIDAIANAVVKKMQEPCDYYDTYNKTCRRSEVPKEPCDDAISRESLKQKLQEHHDFFVNAYSGFSKIPQNDKSRVDEILNCIVMVVNEPSVTPQPKMGHWISHSEHCKMNNLRPSGLASYWWCSECDYGIDYKYFHTVDFKHCPNCGAEMESEV